MVNADIPKRWIAYGYPIEQAEVIFVKEVRKFEQAHPDVEMLVLFSMFGGRVLHFYNEERKKISCIRNYY